MADRPPFDPLRAAFLLLAFVIGVYAIVIVGMVGACIYHSEIIVHSDKNITCDPYNRLIGLMAAALSAALAFAGIGGNRGRNGQDKDKDNKGKDEGAMTLYLTPHFSLEELTASQTAARLGLDNRAPPPVRANLQRLAEVMERVRTLLGDRPVLISSGYRSPTCNRAVGGAGSSAHLSGLAVDFTVPGFGSPKDICVKLAPHMDELGIDQLIQEFPPMGWVHLGLCDGSPRCMALTIDRRGTLTGFV